MRPRLRLLLAVSVTTVAACGSSSGPAGAPTPSPTASTAPPCALVSPAARPPAGQAQALSVIPVRVLTGVPASSGVMDLGTAACVDVGVSQRVALHVRARVPPRPAESPTTRALLSAIAVSPAVATDATPRSGMFTLTFTAQESGSTAITYLAATCDLPPGVC